MKPPVEAPTSSARRPATSSPNASSAFASLRPPRETNSCSAVDRHEHVVGDELARLVGPAALVAQQHLAGDHGGGRARARGEDAPLGEQRVESDLRHGHSVARTLPAAAKCAVHVARPKVCEAAHTQSRTSAHHGWRNDRPPPHHLPPDARRLRAADRRARAGRSVCAGVRARRRGRLGPDRRLHRRPRARRRRAARSGLRPPGVRLRDRIRGRARRRPARARRRRPPRRCSSGPPALRSSCSTPARATPRGPHKTSPTDHSNTT